jgi:hypothetical protein
MKLNRFICIIAAMALLPAVSVFAEGASVIDKGVFGNPQRPAAVFEHDEHNEKIGLEEDCAVCHHVYDGKELVADESSEDYSCSECHSLKSTLDNSVPLRRAFHSRCQTCHFELAKGPVLCGECHTRK